MDYATRKEQIETEFLRGLVKDLRADGVDITPKLRKRLAEVMRSAAMVGACEERHRTLNHLKHNRQASAGDIERFIVRAGVLAVLGYQQ